MRQFWQWGRAGWLGMALLGGVGWAQGPEVSFQAPFITPRSGEQERLPATPPRWTAPLEFRETGGSVLAVAGSAAVSLSGDTLTARQVGDGRVLWRRAGFLSGLAARGGQVAAITRDGQVALLDARTGRELWRKRLTKNSPFGLHWFGGLLYVSGVPLDGQFGVVQMVDGATGKRLLVTRPNEAVEGLAGNLLLTADGSQAYLGKGQTYTAWDVGTGQRRWSVQAGGFLRREGDSLFFQSASRNIQVRHGRGVLELLTVNAWSGRAASRQVPLTFPEVAGTREASYGQVKMDGTCFWVGVSVGDELKAVACQRRDGKTGGTRVRLPEGGRVGRLLYWIAGPVQNHLWFTDTERLIYAARTADGRLSVFLPHDSDFAPLSRFDVTGNRVVVASTDGQVLVYSLNERDANNQLRLLSRHVTRSRLFGPSVIADGMLLVQGEKELLAYPAR